MKWMTLLLIIALLCAVTGFAQEQQSENFRITKSVIDAGGAASSSENFGLYSAFGQPTPVGVQSSENFTLSAGYLSPLFAISPLSPIQALIIQGSFSDILLAWPGEDGANSYKIYRDTVAVFTPGPANYLDMTADTSYHDVSSLSLPARKYFYMVTASSDMVPPEARAAGRAEKAEMQKTLKR